MTGSAMPALPVPFCLWSNLILKATDLSALVAVQRLLDIGPGVRVQQSTLVERVRARLNARENAVGR